MATIGEISTIKILDTNGNEHVTYPITKIEAVDGLEERLNSLPSENHTHEISDISKLEGRLNNKSDINHTHSQNDITGLDTALGNKSNTGHTHTQSDVSGLSTALGNKSNVGHSHNISAINGLSDRLDAIDTQLDGKPGADHTHDQDEITGLVSALSGKVPTTRTVNSKALSSNISLTASDVGAVPKTGGTMTGKLTLSGAPTSNLHAATKQYVDEQVGGGGGMTLHISSSQPTDYADGDMWFEMD